MSELTKSVTKIMTSGKRRHKSKQLTHLAHPYLTGFFFIWKRNVTNSKQSDTVFQCIESMSSLFNELC